MNVDRLIRMIMAIFMRKVISKGMDAGFRAMSKPKSAHRAPEQQLTPEEKEEKQRMRQQRKAVRQARQSARMARRMTKL